MMTLALFIIALIGLLGGAIFYYLNVTSPIQTRLPVILVPVGFIAAILWMGRVL